jgi:peptidoglycan biosynthesis protein MviN/MurJ (putative lipid II flippase)
MYVALVWLLISVALAFQLVEVLGVRGLALASTIAFTFQSIILFILNRRRLGYLYERELLASLGRSLLGVAAMTLTILFIGRFVTAPLILLALGGTLGLAVNFLVSYAVGAREIPDLIRLIRTRN